MDTIFGQIGGIVILAALLAVVMRLLRLPPLIGYITAGVILGPLGFHFLEEGDLLAGMTEIGIAFLLFLVGLELDLEKMKHQFKSAAVVAFFQAISNFGVGLAIAYLMGLPLITGVYLGTGLAFASTVIIVKFLTEVRDINSLHGRLAIGVLLVEDVFAIITLILVSGLSGGSSLGVGQEIFLLLVKSAAMIALVYTLAAYIFPMLFRSLARNAEVLFISSVAWCFLFSLTMTQFDFPIEIGAFMAGVSLASLPYSLDISTRLRSLRDFFLVIFFVSLGAHLIIPSNNQLALGFVLVGLTVIFKPLLSLAVLLMRGYRARTAFLTATTQTQLSEFSLIMAALGIKLGHIGQEVLSTLTFAMVISVLISIVIMGQRHKLFSLFRGVLNRLDKHDPAHEEHTREKLDSEISNHVVIFGYHRMGYHILKKLHQLNHKTVVVDFNPDIVRKLRAVGVDCLYGDVEDEEIFESLHLETASMVVSTIPHHEETLFLIEQVKKHKSKAKLIVTAHEIDDALEYYKKGADYVILPHLLGGEHVSDLITQYQTHSLGRYMRHRAEEVKLLRAKNHSLYFD